MKRVFLIMVSIMMILAFAACTDSGGTDEKKNIDLVLTISADKSEIASDNKDFITISSVLKDNSNKVVTGEAVTFYANDTALSSNIFKTDKEGKYILVGKYKGITSNKIEINAGMKATGLKATPGDGTVYLTWDYVKGAQYFIFMTDPQTKESVEADKDIIKTDNIYTIKNLKNGVQYSFKVKYTLNGKESLYSTLVTATPSSANKIEILDTTKVIGAAVANNITASGDKELTILKSDFDALKLKDGDIIAAGMSEKFPDGFIKKIVSKTVNGNSVKMQVEQANIVDAVGVCDISLKRSEITVKNLTFKPEKGVRLVRADYIDDFEYDREYALELSKVVYDKDGNENTDGDQLKLVGNFKIQEGVKFELKKATWRTVDKFLLKMSVAFDPTFELKASALEAEIKYKEPIRLGTYGYKIVFAIGPIPVVISNDLDILYDPSAKLETQSIGASLAKLEFKAELAVGVAYDKTEGWRNIFNHNEEVNFSLPVIGVDLTKWEYKKTFKVEMTNTIGLKPLIRVYGYDLLYARQNIVLPKITIDLFNDPLWKYKIGFDTLEFGLEKEEFERRIMKLSIEPKVTVDPGNMLSLSGEALKAPANFKLTSDTVAKTIKIEWEKMDDAKKYIVTRDKDDKIPVNTTVTTNYIILKTKDMVPNKKHKFTVKAVGNLFGFDYNTAPSKDIEITAQNEPEKTSSASIGIGEIFKLPDYINSQITIASNLIQDTFKWQEDTKVKSWDKPLDTSKAGETVYTGTLEGLEDKVAFTVDVKDMKMVTTYYFESAAKKIIREQYYVSGGKKNGSYVEYFYNTQGGLYKKSEGNFKNDKKDGKWLYYFGGGGALNNADKQGAISYVETFSDGKLNGEYLEYNEDYEGVITLMVKGSYANDLKDGVWELVDYFQSDVLYKQSYVAGKREGVWYTYIKGKLMAEEPYRNDMKDGISRSYYSSGRVHYEYTYSAGKLIDTKEYEDK